MKFMTVYRTINLINQKNNCSYESMLHMHISKYSVSTKKDFFYIKIPYLYFVFLQDVLPNEGYLSILLSIKLYSREIT